MFTNFKRWFYYRYTRLSIKAKWSKNKLPELSSIQKSTMKIVYTLIINEDSELLVNPILGDKFYIKREDENGDVETFVTISKDSSGYIVTIIGCDTVKGTTHNYHFDVWFDLVCGELMVSKFIRVLKRRRNKIDFEMRKDDERALESILRKIETTKEKKYEVLT